MNRSAGLVRGVVLGSGFVALRTLVRHRRAFDFSGKVALVTGGSRGLGLLLARDLVARGARVAICARDEDELRWAYEDLTQRGGEVLVVTTDITEPEEVEELVRRVRERWGRIEVLINNAGVIQVGPFEEMTREDFETAMSVHFRGHLELTLALLPEMRSRGEGRIINISSVGGVLPVPHLLPYTASKFALTGLSEGLRAELAASGVLVTTVIPGLMRTGSPRNALFKGRHRLEYLWFKLGDSFPLLSMDAAEAARSILDAASQGRPVLVLTLPTKLALRLHGLFPGATAEVMALVSRLLPGPGGVGQEAKRGADSEGVLTRSLLTELTQRAARRNNQMRR